MHKHMAIIVQRHPELAQEVPFSQSKNDHNEEKLNEASKRS